MGEGVSHEFRRESKIDLHDFEHDVQTIPKQRAALGRIHMRVSAKLGEKSVNTAIGASHLACEGEDLSVIASPITIIQTQDDQRH